MLLSVHVLSSWQLLRLGRACLSMTLCILMQMIEDEFGGERAEIQSAYNHQRKDMQDVMAAMEVEFQEAENDARQEFETAREEIKNRNSEDYNILKISLEGQIEELEKTFEAAHQVLCSLTVESL